jgi:glycosyltransferase involved in cell wall biosynthesis
MQGRHRERKDMKISIIMPVFNESRTIKHIIERIKGVGLDKELIIVDDCSTDGTREILQSIKEGWIKVYLHTKNQGKGAAIRTAQEKINGDVVIIQDADLEYQPEEYPNLLKPIKDGFADVVYGSRFFGAHRVFMVYHYVGNKILTLITNFLYNTVLSDMETGYKVFRTEVFKKIRISSNRFNFEPEITAKIFKQRLKVVEVPVTYYGRDYKEGKKITWFDGIKAVFALIKYRFTD